MKDYFFYSSPIFFSTAQPSSNRVSRSRINLTYARLFLCLPLFTSSSHPLSQLLPIRSGPTHLPTSQRSLHLRGNFLSPFYIQRKQLYITFFAWRLALQYLVQPCSFHSFPRRADNKFRTTSPDSCLGELMCKKISYESRTDVS